METLKHKVDFAIIIGVNGANPNGDPLNSNRPRINYDGYGEISDVCIKRKIRNRLMEAKHEIFVQSDDNRVDKHRSLKSRFDAFLESNPKKKEMEKDEDILRSETCIKWIDVRSFGQVFAYKGKSKGKKETDDKQDDKKDASGVSIGIRGPVSIHSAFSVTPIHANVSSIQITKSVSGEGDGTKKASDTMGMKHRVDHGLYVSYGAINPNLAEKTFFSDVDAAAIHEALKHLLDNDASSARPEGSMEVIAVLWWKHNSKHGQYPSAVVHRSLNVVSKIDEPKKVGDYSVRFKTLDGLNPEIFNPNNISIEPF
ncbi:type I-C CRISPR-associated protein Cas7/Csd2 [Candidatus Magnetominusculus xianensis]|uniref:Type I-C CRISPR-associated protein Cas7/Csd2 n=1 Tax=Candidatus Magnetominusculus xianensis TaxID=1748249 RepID=A0ABR5SEX1_9BACT|nr:type I-C CRISPR-associated protein Cas7/Csd2 [Candidatus Magnetominusculus xianensis]KWT83496.1 type I-C CRISPR-associated protein Cas7/Csd2 [Candidatus Magnetominusculus xianensis]MBF0404136.1 type I-C CRISPR-associated protein Cas7/Csd2 [Nitrospirota bacterium]